SRVATIETARGTRKHIRFPSHEPMPTRELYLRMTWANCDCEAPMDSRRSAGCDVWSNVRAARQGGHGRGNGVTWAGVALATCSYRLDLRASLCYPNNVRTFGSKTGQPRSEPTTRAAIGGRNPRIPVTCGSHWALAIQVHR